MPGSRDVDELEIEEQDSGNPTVDSSVGLDVGVVNHALDVFSVYLDNKLTHIHNINTRVTKCAKESVEFCLGLRVVALRLVPEA